MAKDNPTEQKTKAQATIQVQEVKEIEVAEIEQEKPILTLKERIKKVVEESCSNSQIDDLIVPPEVKAILEKNIFALIQRVLHPEQFCPNCDERLFFNVENSSYNCPNCNYQSTITSNNITRVVPRVIGKVPEVVEKAIAEASEAGKDIPIPTKPTALGDKIRKLVADRDAGGPAAPTKEDEARIKGSDKNVANKINWV